MKKKDLLFTVPVFRETNVYVLAGDREEARRIAEECVLSGLSWKSELNLTALIAMGFQLPGKKLINWRSRAREYIPKIPCHIQK